MRKQIFALLAGAMLMMVTSAMATLIGPTQDTYGDVAYLSNSINATYSAPYGSSGNLTWSTDSNINVAISFDYLILGNSALNNAYIFDDLSWGTTYFSYKDGLTHHYSGEVFLGAGNSITLHAYAGASENVLLSDISISDANGSAPVPEPGTMMLLGIGLFGMAVYGKRRMNKNV